MTAVWPDPDPGWRVRIGVSLVEYAPLGDERRALIDREAEKERRAAELEAEQRRERAYEHRWELERRGVVPHTVGDVLQAASVAADRQDRRDARDEAEAAEIMGRPVRHPHTLWKLKADAAAKREAEATEPTTLAAVKREVEKETSGIKIALWKLKHGKA